jgi:hypothetical protein
VHRAQDGSVSIFLTITIKNWRLLQGRPHVCALEHPHCPGKGGHAGLPLRFVYRPALHSTVRLDKKLAFVKGRQFLVSASENGNAGPPANA